ncbi:MAG TPA: amidohydrolase family protein [Methanomicrobiales archaeon]|jgi:cytosine/adenosine deaminase-related metal-dependent hydrolase|nr:amidohydrolase family protein [Methanomicrobiales archaeon]
MYSYFPYEVKKLSGTMPTDFEVTGHALVGRDLEPRPARITVRDGEIREIAELPSAPPLWICPALFNAHTHVGDTVAMDAPWRGSLEELVTPPDGLKHRILRETPRPALIGGMRASIGVMVRSGTGGFADFREGGRDGVRDLREAAEGLPCRPVVFGRDGGEEIAEGLGIPSARDSPDAGEAVARARRAGKPVAFHAGERDALDIDGALRYDPDLLVHCTHASDRQLREIADRGIPVAVCPRSNWVLGVSSSPAHPPVRRMLDLGITLLLGTDNAMFVQPDLWAEMAFIHTVYRVDPREVLGMAVRGSACLSVPSFLEEGSPARFLVIDAARSNLAASRDPVASLVKRAGPSDVTERYLF